MQRVMMEYELFVYNRDYVESMLCMVINQHKTAVHAEQTRLTVQNGVWANGKYNVGSPFSKAVMQRVTNYGFYM